MKFYFVSKDVELTPSMREAAEEKLAKFEKYFKEDSKATTTISILPKGRKAVEVSIVSGSFQLRAKTIDEDFYSALDLLVDKLEGQMRKIKTQLRKVNKGRSLAENLYLEQVKEAAEPKAIVKRKKLSLAPMDVEEAMARMDALGHSFFIYLDSETMKVHVLYQRDDESFGDIEIE